MNHLYIYIHPHISAPAHSFNFLHEASNEEDFKVRSPGTGFPGRSSLGLGGEVKFRSGGACSRRGRWAGWECETAGVDVEAHAGGPRRQRPVLGVPGKRRRLHFIQAPREEVKHFSRARAASDSLDGLRQNTRSLREHNADNRHPTF